MKKYLVLDFGKVLAYPKTGDWFITPLFLELIDMNKITSEEILKAMSNYGDILSRKAVLLEEEYHIFYDFYKATFDTLKYPVSEEILDKLAKDFTYTDNKYGFYKDIYDEFNLSTFFNRNFRFRIKKKKYNINAYLYRDNASSYYIFNIGEFT